MKLNVLFSSGLGENRGGAQIALPSTGTTNRMASSHSVIAEPGAVPDLVGATSLIHEASLTLGVESVTQLDDKRLHWVAEIAGTRREWDAEIVDQEPHRRDRLAKPRRHAR